MSQSSSLRRKAQRLQRRQPEYHGHGRDLIPPVRDPADPLFNQQLRHDLLVYGNARVLNRGHVEIVRSPDRYGKVVLRGQ